MTYALEDGIALPRIARPGRRRKYPFPGMTPGQSFTVSAIDEASCRTSCSQWKKRNPGWKFATRNDDEGTMRVWRIA